MNHRSWVTTATGGAAIRAISRATGIPDRTLSDQLDRNRVTAEHVIAIAIAFGAHPVTALIDCDYLPPRYASIGDPIASLRMVSEDALADEVLRRMKLVGDHTTLTTPIDELLEQRSADDTEVGPTADSGLQGVVTAIAGKLDIENGDQRGQQMG